MGWDAISSANKTWKSRSKAQIKIINEFTNAIDNVIKKTGSVDGGLEVGCLDTSACRYMLEKAAESSKESLNWGLAYSEGGMSVEAVKVMHMFLNWDFKYKKDDAWAYWSAKEFVRVCAENGLSIRFDY